MVAAASLALNQANRLKGEWTYATSYALVFVR